MKRTNAPWIANLLLRLLLPKEDYLEKTGDLEEVYSSMMKEKGKAIASAWYLIQAVKSIPSIIANSLYWGTVMIVNYFKIASRNMLKQKTYTLITVSGLAVGLGIFLLIFRFNSWRMNVDSFNKDIERTYNLVQVFKSQGEGDRHTEYVPYPLGTVVKSTIPEVEDITGFVQSGQVILKYGDKKFFEDGALYTDANFLSFFTYDILKGNEKTILSKPHSIVLSRKMAEKFFGDENPIGKIITLVNKTDLEVTGVVDYNRQYYTSIWFSCLISMDVYQSLGNKPEDWGNSDYTEFVKLKKGTDTGRINNKLAGILNSYFPKSPESPKGIYIFPTSLNEHDSPHIQKYCNNSDPGMFTIFLILGVLILLIVSINFINLATARSINRSKEVGIRKTIGAGRFQLITQFLGETILTTLIAIPLACLVYYLFGNWINYQLGGNAAFASFGGSISFSFFDNKELFPLLVAIALVTGFLSGLYPAFILSSFRPVNVLKNKFKTGRNRGVLRKVLVGGQIAISIIFIVATIVLIKQSALVNTADMGYNRDNVIIAPASIEAQQNYQVLKEEMKKNPSVISVSASEGVPGTWGTRDWAVPDGKSKIEALRVYSYGIDYDYFETFGMQLISGRTFSKNYNDENNFIVSESYTKQPGYSNSIGRSLEIGKRKGTIIGVVKDVHLAGMGWPQRHAVFYLEKKYLNRFFIKYSGANTMPGIKENLTAVWNNLNPDVPLETTTLKLYLADTMADVDIISKFIGIIGVTSMFFSSLGFLAMVAFTSSTRKKEIAVRKVHGATYREILILLGKDFVRIILYAFAVGFPIAYLLANKMLEPYTIKTQIGPDIFLFAFLIIVAISAASIIKEITKAARQNPVDAIKCE